jgi:AcrR family transcriptional regulator
MTKQQRGLDTMARVLDAALDCFARTGVYATRIEDLAEKAKVSVGSLYHHFGGRERVAFLLYRRCMESLMGTIAAAVLPKKTARDGVRALVRSYLGWVAENREAARYIYAAASQAELLEGWKADMTEFKGELVSPFVKWFQVHIDAGAIIALPPALMEVVVVGPPAEFARRWLSGVPGLQMEAAVKSLPDAVWRAVATPVGAAR